MEVNLKDFIRGYNKYLDKEFKLYRKGELLGTWIPVGVEESPTVQMYEACSDPANYIKNPCSLCDKEGDYQFWEEGVEYNICNLCLERKFPNPKILAAAKRNLTRI